jgi:hypothetical protein
MDERRAGTPIINDYDIPAGSAVRSVEFSRTVRPGRGRVLGLIEGQGGLHPKPEGPS